MITAIHEANYYPFASALQAKLNETYGEFLKKCDGFFDKHDKVAKNFATYIRGSDPLHPHKNKTYFIVELDDYVLLDLTGEYEVKTDAIKNASFRATLPFHETWHSDYFQTVTLSKTEKNHFLFLQENFFEFSQRMGVRIVVDIEAFNPEADALPEAVVDIVPVNGSLDTWIQEPTFFSFLVEYYKYCLEVDGLFDKIWKQVQTKKA